MKKHLFVMFSVVIPLILCNSCENDIAIHSVSITQQNVVLSIGESEALTATTEPKGLTAGISWTVSDKSVLSIDENGTVTAMSKGVADAIATINGISGKTRILVHDPAITGITVNPKELNLKIGEHCSLKATTIPEQLPAEEISWTSSDESIALTDYEGNIYSIGIGKAYIKASAGGVVDSCLVTVEGVSVESISISPSEITLTQGEYTQLTATITPENATDKTIKWTSSDEAIVNVNAVGKITAVSGGNATITAKCGNAEAICEVSVVTKLHVGDYYYADGSSSSSIIDGKEVIGIIFHIDETGKQGKIVSMKEKEKTIYGPGSTSGARSSTDGLSNMNTIKKLPGWEESYPAFKWCDDLSDGGLEWYIGAPKEMRILFAYSCGLILTDELSGSDDYVTDWENITGGMPDSQNETYKQARVKFNERIQAAGGAPLQETYYWTSEESTDSASWAYFINLKTGGTTSTRKSFSWFIRPIATVHFQ